jgi:NAD(P)-dependent dehydrogenase (short-subunit alcohol dehydrogenase family)
MLNYATTQMNTGETTARAALVTGAGKRLGRAIALGLARDGWDIAVHFHHSEAEAEFVVKEIRGLGVRAAAFGCDLDNADDTAGLVARCTECLGPLTCLVNNASLFEYDDLASLEPASWDRHMNVNLRAPLLLAQAFSRQLPEAARGCIINLLDQKLSNLNPDFLSYTIAKIGLEGATRLLATALAPRIRVCGVAPGITLIARGQSEESFQRARRLALLGNSSEVEDVVDAVLYLVGARAVTGVTVTVDGGQHLLPLRRDVQFEVEK